MPRTRADRWPFNVVRGADICAGMLHRYPKATFHLQDSEMDYATGRCMCSNLLRRGYDVEDVVHLVRCVHADRVAFHHRSDEIPSGLTVHRTGGTPTDTRRCGFGPNAAGSSWH